MARETDCARASTVPTKAHVHGHCHQKSFGAFDADARGAAPDAGSRPSRRSRRPVAAWPGAFGYQSETQDVSRAMAEADLLPAVRKAKPEELIVADGIFVPASDRRPLGAHRRAFGPRAGRCARRLNRIGRAASRVNRKFRIFCALPSSGQTNCRSNRLVLRKHSSRTFAQPMARVQLARAPFISAITY